MAALVRDTASVAAPQVPKNKLWLDVKNSQTCACACMRAFQDLDHKAGNGESLSWVCVCTCASAASPVWAERGCRRGRGAWRQGRPGPTAAGWTHCSCRRWPDPPRRWSGPREHPTGWMRSTCRSLGTQHHLWAISYFPVFLGPTRWHSPMLASRQVMAWTSAPAYTSLSWLTTGRQSVWTRILLLPARTSTRHGWCFHTQCVETKHWWRHLTAERQFH